MNVLCCEQPICIASGKLSMNLPHTSKQDEVAVKHSFGTPLFSTVSPPHNIGGACCLAFRLTRGAIKGERKKRMNKECPLPSPSSFLVAHTPPQPPPTATNGQTEGGEESTLVVARSPSLPTLPPVGRTSTGQAAAAAALPPCLVDKRGQRVS